MVVVTTIGRHGLDGLLLATVMAGVFLAAMGALPRRTAARRLFGLVPSIADQPIHGGAYPRVATDSLAEFRDQGAKFGAFEKDRRADVRKGMS